MKIQKIGIIGAGNMGSGIAQKVAQEGIQVLMVDVKDQYVKKGLENIKQTLSEGVQRKIFTEEQAKEILSRIRGTTIKEEVKDADLVIEAIFEDMDVKKDLFKELDKIWKEEWQTIYGYEGDNSDGEDPLLKRVDSIVQQFEEICRKTIN